jgi:uncharacterized membrane protein
MKDFLQGKWLGHSLHAALVHLPIALWPAAFVFDLLSNFGVGGNAMVKTSFYAIVLGFFVALLAAPAGLADWLDIKPEHPARKIGWYHMILNLAGVLLWGSNLLLRLNVYREATAVAFLPTVLSFIGTLVLLVSGYLGGMMVYHHGISVARVSKEKWRRLAEASGANVSS